MSKTKKVTISMTKETKAKAIQQSIDVLGKKNLSGYITYLINREENESNNR